MAITRSRASDDLSQAFQSPIPYRTHTQPLNILPKSSSPVSSSEQASTTSNPLGVGARDTMPPAIGLSPRKDQKHPPVTAEEPSESNFSSSVSSSEQASTTSNPSGVGARDTMSPAIGLSTRKRQKNPPVTAEDPSESNKRSKRPKRPDEMEIACPFSRPYEDKPICEVVRQGRRGVVPLVGRAYIRFNDISAAYGKSTTLTTHLILSLSAATLFTKPTTPVGHRQRSCHS